MGAPGRPSDARGVGSSTGPYITVLTPTYNRAGTLPLVYRCLAAQTFDDFEWLVVDDGSSDETEALVREWMASASFAVRYERQENGGKPSAVNLGARLARGTFTVILDSDDTCIPTALHTFADIWSGIPVERRAEFSGVAVHTATPDGRIVGTPFPRDVMDAHGYEMAFRYGVRGEKWGMQRTDILRATPYPLAPGERWAPEALAWNRIGRRYLTRHVNTALRIYEPSSDGITSRVRELMRRNPNGTAMYYREVATLDIGWRWRCGALLRHAVYARHAGRGARAIIAESPAPLLTAAALPLAGALGLLERRRTAGSA